MINKRERFFYGISYIGNLSPVLKRPSKKKVVSISSQLSNDFYQTGNDLRYSIENAKKQHIYTSH